MHSGELAPRAEKTAADTDLVVVIPGIMGTSLEDRDGREVWGLGAGGIIGALRTLGGSIRDLTLPPDIGYGPADDGVCPRSLIPGLHMIPGLWSPIQGYGELARFLTGKRFGLIEETESQPGNLIFFPYDWRLSNRWNATLLKQRVETTLSRWRESSPARGQAKIVFITHSMGGLIARWYIEQLCGLELVRALITLGTPHRGALKALAQLVNGVRKGIGPLRLDLTDFARSLPSSYELLPEYACLDAASGEMKKTTEVTIPHLDPERIQAGMAFHEELNTGTIDYELIPMVGIGQPTATAASLADERLEVSDVFADKELGGDGTVPRLSARPFQMKERDAAIRGVGDGHGALASNRSVLDQLELVLTAEDVVYRFAAPEGEPSEREVIGLRVPDVHLAGEPVRATVHAVPRALEVVAIGDGSRVAASELVRFRSVLDEEGREIGEATIEGLAPGAYTLVCRAPDDPGALRASPVHASTLIWND